MKAIAKTRFAQYSPRKVQQVLDLIKGKPVAEAFRILKFITKRARIIVEKTLNSAVANAGRLKTQDGVYIKECHVGQGHVLKRWRSRAFGRAVVYRHKSCHLTVIVTDERKKRGV